MNNLRVICLAYKINKLAKRNLCCDNAENSESEKEALLKKQLMKTFKSEKSEK